MPPRIALASLLGQAANSHWSTALLAQPCPSVLFPEPAALKAHFSPRPVHMSSSETGQCPEKSICEGSIPTLFLIGWLWTQKTVWCLPCLHLGRLSNLMGYVGSPHKWCYYSPNPPSALRAVAEVALSTCTASWAPQHPGQRGGASTASSFLVFIYKEESAGTPSGSGTLFLPLIKRTTRMFLILSPAEGRPCSLGPCTACSTLQGQSVLSELLACFVSSSVS